MPGKVLKPILGRPMLELQIERIQRSLLIDEIIIATSVQSQDDPLEKLAHKLGIGCYRGSEDDVLSRVVETLRAFDAGVHVEFMGDNPIPDPMLIDSIVGYYLKNSQQFDYVSNSLLPTYPPGADVYVYPAEVLYDAEARLEIPENREHVGYNIDSRPDRYRIKNLVAPPWFHRPDMHLEVDTAEDFEVVSSVYEILYPANPGFGLGHVIDFIDENMQILSKNEGVERRWKALRGV